MACIRLSFEKWVNSEPEELDNDHPSEEQMIEFEEAEKRHAALVSCTCLASEFHAHMLTADLSGQVSCHRATGIPALSDSRCWEDQ